MSGSRCISSNTAWGGTLSRFNTVSCGSFVRTAISRSVIEVDFIEPQVVLRKHLRKKYRCSCGGCVKTAAGPKKLFPKARYSINFALHVALQKYCYHLPLERQARELSRRGLDVTSTTLWDYVNRAMPFDRPGVLNPPEVYAAVAYVLNLNGIIEADRVMDAASLPQVKMPNRDGFVADPRPDVRKERRWQ